MTDGIETVDQEVPENADGSKISVAGDFLDRVAVLTSVNVSLVLSPGRRRDNGSRVLVPFVSLDMAGSSILSDEPQSYVSEIISLDNLAFLTAALANELQRVTTDYVEVIEGSAHLDVVEQSRLEAQMRKLLGHAHTCVEMISATGRNADTE